MDRQYKAEDTVIVYESSIEEKPIGRFKQKPFTLHGMENYEYNCVMYKGYTNLETGETYILLSSPLFKGK